MSSYPQPHIPHGATHVPPPPFPQQAPTASTVPSSGSLKEPFSPAPPSTSSSTNIQAETPPSTASTPSESVSQTPPALSLPKEPFYPPVSDSTRNQVVPLLTSCAGAMALSWRYWLSASSSATETQNHTFITIQRAHHIPIDRCRAGHRTSNGG